MTSLFDENLIDENDGFFQNYCDSAGLKYVDHETLGIRGMFVSQAIGAFDNHRALGLALKEFPNIAVGIYEDIEIQAFATKWNNFYVIGISTGFLNQIAQALSVDLSKIPMFKDLQRSHETGLRAALFNQCCTFVIEHEFVHIINGHLDYTRASRLGGKISEKHRRFKEPRQELTISQVLEMDADMCAMSTILGAGKTATSYIEQGMFPDWHPLSNLKSYFSAAYLCSAIVFKILGDGDFEQGEVGTSTHPLPRVRQYYLMLNLVGFNQAYDCGFTETDLQKIISESFWAAENIVNLATGNETNRGALAPKYFDQHPLHQEMRTIWKDIVHDELIKYAFVPIVGKNGEATKFVAPNEEKIDLMKAALGKLSQ